GDDRRLARHGRAVAAAGGAQGAGRRHHRRRRHLLPPSDPRRRRARGAARRPRAPAKPRQRIDREDVMSLPLLPTSLVGSYAQPEWLIDRKKLAGRFPPRVRAKELWRVAPEFLDQAQDDATLLAIRDQERAGLDIITDGEMRRESYSNRFATALDG